ncbi:MAG: type IV pilus assembly protein PilM [Candidatus Omnitrophica bacterium]|nr:type IV pilus assembly protein PilM [Candidatus Omnitrophota bacterium]
MSNNKSEVKHKPAGFFSMIRKSLFFLDPPQNSLGISIGHQNIIIVELNKSQEVPRMVRLTVQEVPEENANITDILKAMFQMGGFSNTFINASLSGKAVIIRFLKFPKMSKKELRSALEFEAEKYIPFKINDIYLDFSVLRSDSNMKFVEVALVVAKKDAVHELLTQCQQANLNVKAIDTDAFACCNAFLAAYPEEKMKTTALINIGAKLTNLVIMSEGMPAFSRDIYFGGDDVTKGLSKQLHINLPEASKLKYKINDSHDERIETIVQGILNHLITEIELSFDYFENHFQKKQEPVEVIYLVGGTSRLGGLADLFEKSLRTKTVLFDPLRCVTVDNSVNQSVVEQYANSLAVPIGLALR